MDVRQKPRTVKIGVSFCVHREPGSWQLSRLSYVALMIKVEYYYFADMGVFSSQVILADIKAHSLYAD